jgi:CRP/FNR family transcriptional regulator
MSPRDAHPVGMSIAWFQPLDLSASNRAALAALPHRHLPAGTPLFHPGDPAQAFVIVLTGRIEVMLTGPSGREILLYAVEPGQTCIQTTLGLMGDQPYSGDAATATPCEVVLIPKPLFLSLIDAEPGFRRFVMQAFGARMADLTHLLERVAFGRIEQRLAAALLDLAQGALVQATHAELAARIGSAREVVSRRLEGFARQGWVSTDRGTVTLFDRPALQQLASQPD